MLICEEEKKQSLPVWLCSLSRSTPLPSLRETGGVTWPIHAWRTAGSRKRCALGAITNERRCRQTDIGHGWVIKEILRNATPGDTAMKSGKRLIAHIEIWHIVIDVSIAAAIARGIVNAIAGFTGGSAGFHDSRMYVCKNSLQWHSSCIVVRDMRKINFSFSSSLGQLLL